MHHKGLDGRPLVVTQRGAGTRQLFEDRLRLRSRCHHPIVPGGGDDPSRDLEVGEDSEGVGGRNLHAAPILEGAEWRLNRADRIRLIRVGVGVVLELPDGDEGRLPGGVDQRLVGVGVRREVGGQLLRSPN